LSTAGSDEPFGRTEIAFVAVEPVEESQVSQINPLLEQARVVDGSRRKVCVAARMELQRLELRADLRKRTLAPFLERRADRLAFVELLEARDARREEGRNRERILPVGDRRMALRRSRSGSRGSRSTMASSSTARTKRSRACEDDESVARSAVANFSPMPIPPRDGKGREAPLGSGGQGPRDDEQSRGRSRSQPRPHNPWAELLRRTFEVDVLACPECGGRLRCSRPSSSRRWCVRFSLTWASVGML
jgi:hypothetical protein